MRIILLIIFTLVFAPQDSFCNMMITKQSFKDTKNSLFECTYPKAWKRHIYNDSRTKIKFYDSQNKNRYVSIIAKKSTKSFDSIWKDALNTKAKMKSKGVVCSLDTLNVNNTDKAAVVKSDLSKYNAGYTELLLFVKNGIHFNVQFCANSKSEMNKYREDFTDIVNSIDTNISVLKSSKKKSSVSNW